MPLDADEVMRATIGAWERLVTALPGAWTRLDRGALGVVSGVDLPGFNGVWSDTAEVGPAAVAGLLDDVRAAGVPHCLQLRAGWPGEVARIAQERDLVRVDGEPIMVLEDDRELDGALAVPGLSLRELAPEEGPLHARIAAGGGVVGKEAPYRKFAAPEVLRTTGLRCYVGEVDGEPVTTALGLVADGYVGIFCVATLPSHRRRGYGAAVTARAARDGLDAGARKAWLSASAAGYPVYRRLGFVAVEQRDFWEQAKA